MNRKLITFGFLRMMLPPSSSKSIVDTVSEATMKRLQEDARWREYEFPAYRRFQSTRPNVRVALPAVQLDALPIFLRRQAE